MKIVGINTSPRPNSNIKIALEKALEAAEAKGAETQIFNTNSMNISCCQADDACKKLGGKCAVDDDMVQIYEAIESADAIIFATPIYMFDFAAQAKIVMDRFYSYFMTPKAEELTPMKMSFIVSQGQEDAGLYQGIVDNYANLFAGLFGFEIVDKEIFADNNVPAAINEKEDQLAQAVKVGENIVG